MAKGGFILEMLASKHATSDVGFLWRFLYYTYIAFPLLIVYYLIYLMIVSRLVRMVLDLLGIGQPGWHNMFMPSTTDMVLTVLASIGVTVALYHFKVLPYLFAPVNMLISV